MYVHMHRNYVGKDRYLQVLFETCIMNRLHIYIIAGILYIVYPFAKCAYQKSIGRAGEIAQW